MFAASGVFLLSVAGFLLFGLATIIARQKPAFKWPFLALTGAFAVAALWGWTR
jgi:hypothetical protein